MEYARRPGLMVGVGARGGNKSRKELACELRRLGVTADHAAHVQIPR